MPNYSPPPADLSGLNPIQRYMQKGQLDRKDWFWLGAFVLTYFMIRPYLMEGAKWLFAPKEGVAQQEAYAQRRAKAKIGANAIRGGSNKDDTTLADLDEAEDNTAVTSGSKAESKTETTTTTNRKKPKKVAFQSEQDKLLDWDDEPARTVVDGGQTDVMKWLDKWDQ